jgi:hypothetical protein
VALVWVLTTLCLWVHQQLVLGVKVRSLVCSQPGLAALSVAVSILSHVISRLAAVSFTVAWFFLLLRPMSVEVRLATVDWLEAVTVAKLAMVMVLSCWRSLWVAFADWQPA